MFDKQITQAKHAETDPCHGTPTMAHFQQPEQMLDQRCTVRFQQFGLEEWAQPLGAVRFQMACSG